MELDTAYGRGVLGRPAHFKHVSHSTLRGYDSALRAFTGYISNPDYGWDRICEKYFGTHCG